MYRSLLSAISCIFVFASCEILQVDVTTPKSLAAGESICHFEVEVDYKGEKWTDCGVLMLPRGYNLHPAQTDLVIYCHSGGGTVNEFTSECENMEYNKYLVSKGYAVFSMASMPVAYATRLGIDQYRTVGSELSILCSYTGYKYVTELYEFSGRVFLLSNSNGGLLASNLVHFTDIPFLAQSGIAPLISIELNTWEVTSKALSGGRFERLQNRANIISLYGMTLVSSLSELEVAKYEKDKVGYYDPYDYYMNTTESAYPIPYLIFSCIDDRIVYHSIADLFSKEMSRRGSLVLVDTTTSLGAHNVQSYPVIVGSFDYAGHQYETNEVYLKIESFFGTYN